MKEKLKSCNNIQVPQSPKKDKRLGKHEQGMAGKRQNEVRRGGEADRPARGCI